MHEGHRKRILERVEEDDGLQDHELLEVLLFNAIPRKNTNGLAHALLQSFGTLGGVLHASIRELSLIEGVGNSTAAYLHAVGLAFDRIAKEEPSSPPEIYSPATFKEFLTAHFQNVKEEHVEVFCLAEDGSVLFHRSYTSHSLHRVTVPIEDVSTLISVHHPHGMVLAHNHPHAPCKPSEEDDDFTYRILVLCTVNGVSLDDHIVVGEDGYYSYFTSGKLTQMRLKLTQADLFRFKGLS